MIAAVLGVKRREPDPEPVLPEPVHPWRVIRLASKDQRTRAKEGGDKSAQLKVRCPEALLQLSGVVGERPSWFGIQRIEDFNNYRSQGHAGKFAPCTNDRAVSVVAASSYDALRAALPLGTVVRAGDLGENILLSGPSLESGDGPVDLRVGRRLKIGGADGAVIELTEANKPCYRLNRNPWGPVAKATFGVDGVDPARWFDSPSCPLSQHHLGGRGT